VAMREQNLLDGDSRFFCYRNDFLDIAAGINDRRPLRLITNQQRAILDKGRDSNDGVLHVRQYTDASPTTRRCALIEDLFLQRVANFAQQSNVFGDRHRLG
jgi:hypothetical protein